MRKLASVQRISSVEPIEGADRVELAKVLGWPVVVQKGLYKQDDVVVYFEIDSFIPSALCSLSDKTNKCYVSPLGDIVSGNVLRTATIRGQLSQGLILPIEAVKKYCHEITDVAIGDDLTKKLKIFLEPKPHSHAVKGPYPFYVIAKDPLRVQSLDDFEAIKKHQYNVTEKLEGCAFSAHVYDGEEIVLSSRNSLKEDPTSISWLVARKNNLFEKIKNTGRKLSLHGEIIGPKIQGNYYKINENKLYVYDIWDIDNQCYLKDDEVDYLCYDFNLDRVPSIASGVDITEETIESLLLKATFNSRIKDSILAEGLIYKTSDGNYSFKVISNKFLKKGK